MRPISLVLAAALAAAGATSPPPATPDAFRTAVGHTAAACRARAGDLEEEAGREAALRYLRLATFLDPEDLALRDQLLAWRVPPHGPPSDLLTRIGPVDGPCRRALSLSWLGESAAALEVIDGRRGAVAEAVRSQLLSDLGRFEQARAILDTLEETRREAQAFVLFMRSILAQWEGDAAAELAYLKAATAVAPDSVEVRGSLAARAVSEGNAREAERFLRFEAALPRVSDPWRLATRASLLAALGRTDAASQSLDRLHREHLPSPQTWITEAGLRLRQGRPGEAAAALEEMVGVTRGSLVLIPAANLLASIGRQDLARQALDRLEPEVASRPRVQRLFDMLAVFPDAEHRVEGRDGPLAFITHEDTPKEAVRGALHLFRAAREAVDRRLGMPGPIPTVIVIAYRPGEPPWGYYDAVNRRIVCRGDYRAVGRAKGADATLAHVARHEYGHLAFDARIRRAGEGVVPYPRWMMEGIADQLAGGTDYLLGFGYSERQLRGPSLDEGALNRILASPVMGFGKIRQADQARAYAQSYAMVGQLLERLHGEDPWRDLATFVRQLGQGRDLGKALAERFETDVPALIRRAAPGPAAASR
jgi:hypothetical protein